MGEEKSIAVANDRQVGEKMEAVKENIAYLIDRVALLETRLSYVTKEIPPEKDENSVDEILVPLAMSLNRFSKDINNTANRVASMIDRLEL